MSVEACAELVKSSDPDRYAVTVFAAEDVQRILWPLYAFNVEVSRAPWVTQEPMIAEIRLQWWRDALEEIREGNPVRNHEVTQPLAAILDAEGAMSLDKLVDARKWDIYSDPFASRADFDSYIDATYGNLIWTAARLIAPEADQKIIRDFAYASGVAAMLRASPALKACHKNPLPEDTAEAFGQLAADARSSLEEVASARRSVPNALIPLLMSGWQTRPTLDAVGQNSDGVYAHGFSQSELARRFRLLKLSYFGWWR